MKPDSRTEILERLKKAPAATGVASPRPAVPALAEVSMDRDGLVKTFMGRIGAVAQVVERARDDAEVLSKLSEIVRNEGIKTIMAANDDVVAILGLATWGKREGVTVKTHLDYPDRRSYVDAAFDLTDAGITGVDYAIAETGTMVIVHAKNHPRLVSHAPLRHVVVVPAERILPTYEDAVDVLYTGGRRPAHVTWISAPSQSADIQGIMFLGMHGPQRLIVIVRG